MCTCWHAAKAMAIAAITVLGSAARAELGPELVSNGGFETGSAPWFAFGTASVAPNGSDPQDGSLALRVTNRTDTWNGPAQFIPVASLSSGTYEASVWVKLLTPASHQVLVTLKRDDATGTNYAPAAVRTIAGNQWVRLRGWYDLNYTGALEELILYVEGPPAGVNFEIDSVSFRRVDLDTNWRPDADARIEQLRKGDARIVVRSPSGTPIEGAAVEVTQTKKAFPFGSAISMFQMGNQTYLDFFKDHFNWAVTENALKWPQTEPAQGVYTWNGADSIVAFCQANNIPLRGHNMFWAVQQFVPSWVQAFSGAALTDVVNTRIDTITARYAGEVVHWDINNEMLHGDFFEANAGPGTRADMFARAKQVDPNALTFINDYNIVTANEFFDYIDQIQDLEAQGAVIDGIGVQGHFGATVDAPAVLAKLDTLAALGKPIWVTELDVDQPNKAIHADELEEAFRVLYSHPAVEGVLIWGFWEDQIWKPNTAIVNSDWTLNAAGERYVSLMDEWSTEVVQDSDLSGLVEFRGFHGDYDVAVTSPGGGAPVTAQLSLAPDASGVTELIVTLDLGGCFADLTTDGVPNGVPDGVVSLSDFSYYLSLWSGGNTAADFTAEGTCVAGTGEGVVTLSDFSCYLSEWSQGCP